MTMAIQKIDDSFAQSPQIQPDDVRLIAEAGYKGMETCCFARRRGQLPESAGNCSGRDRRTGASLFSIYDFKNL